MDTSLAACQLLCVALILYAYFHVHKFMQPNVCVNSKFDDIEQKELNQYIFLLKKLKIHKREKDQSKMKSIHR